MNDLSRPKRHFALVGYVLLFWVAYLVILVLVSKVKSLVPNELGQLVWGAVCSILLLALSLILLKRNARTPSDVGLGFNPASLLRLAAGGIVGLAIPGLILVIFIAFTGPFPISWSAKIHLSQVMLVISTCLTLSCMEELGFRGYPLPTLVQNIGFWQAQGTVEVAFALCHILYGWSWQSVCYGVLPSGLLFGIAAIVSRGLALPIGLHAGLNIGQWAVGDTGLLLLSLSEKQRARIATITPITGMSVVLLTAFAFWFWHRHRCNLDASEAGSISRG
ncbi:MAG: hypothetical protein JWN25_742 [Verrucomicrobiales bacterium]|nr:hypothetical protein [Verrucomicrobiales bacterium]